MALSESVKRREIKKYFKGRSRWLSWLLIVVGFFTIPLLGLGLILIIAGITIRLVNRTSQFESKIDAWTDEDFNAHNYVARARQLCYFANYEREPVLIRGFAGESLAKSVFKSDRLGDDGKIRATPIAATVILCGPDQLGIYQTGIDLTTGNRVNEGFWEVFYQDVTSIGVLSGSHTIDFKEIFGGLFKRILARLGIIGLAATEQTKGYTARNIRKALLATRDRYEKYLISEMLQRELTKTYRIDLADGEHITIITKDERATREANKQNDAAEGNEVARSMIALRSFVREKKRYLLHARPSGTGALV